MSFPIRLQNVRCWDPSSGFSVFLEDSGEIDLEAAAIAEESPSIQIGPYKVNIVISSNNLLENGSGAMNISVDSKPLSMAQSSHGSIFYQVDNVDVIAMDGSMSVLGSARGCFDISW